MFSKSFICLFAFLGLSLAIPTPSIEVPNKTNRCAEILRSANISESFDTLVAHAVHSMTVDILKKFDPSATENNFVPTIQHDLRAEMPILPYAQDLKSKDSDMFETEGMKVLDMILSHMNEKHWDIAAFNSLERVIHAFHMREVWARIQKQFEKIGKTIPTPENDLCECALDLENNGIMKSMRFVAMAIREPTLVYGDKSFTDRNYDGPLKQYSVYGQYTYNFKKSDILKQGDQTQIKDMFLHELTEAMPPLVDAKAWDFWKGKAQPPAEHDRDVAMFLYCAIEKAHQTK